MINPRSRKAASNAAAAMAENASAEQYTSALPPSPVPAKNDRRPRKRELVLALITRVEGASTAELMAATGWQEHTVRAALSMLRREGNVITRRGRGPTMRYHLDGVRQ